MAEPVSAASTFWDLKASGVLKFITDFVSAVAWPAAAAFIVSLFRKEIIERIPKLSELTLPGGISAKFNEGLAKVEAELAGASSREEAAEASPATREAEAPDEELVPEDNAQPAATDPPAPITPSVPETDVAALNINPAGTVMVAWQRLDQLLRQAAMTLLGPNIAALPASNVVAHLRNSGFLQNEEEAAILDLINLRNLAAHSASTAISPAEATRFISVSDQLRGKLIARLTRRAIRMQGIRPPPSPPFN